MVLEGFFRFLPVSYPPHLLDVNEQNPLARFQENRDYRWSRDWDFSIVTRKHTNNLGFTSDYDYIKNDSGPLLTVIGDSFVEAQQVANAESMSGVLAQKVSTSGRVYSLGLSGAALSQYLVFADYAKQVLDSDAMVFIIVGNDFDESLLKYKSEPRFHYFEEKAGAYHLRRIDFRVGMLKKILRKSAFMRYLLLNLKIRQLRNPFASNAKDSASEFVGNVARDVSKERLRDSEAAVDEFFRLLPEKTGLDKQSILFVVDGMRPNLYSKSGLAYAKDSFHSRMRSYFMSAAERIGYEVKDMQPVFIDRNQSDGSRFEFSRDAHWNQLGHALVASEIAGSRVFENTFSNR